MKLAFKIMINSEAKRRFFFFFLHVFHCFQCSHTFLREGRFENMNNKHSVVIFRANNPDAAADVAEAADAVDAVFPLWT